MVTSLPSNHRRMPTNYLPLLRKSMPKERTLMKKVFSKLKKLKKKLLRISHFSLVLKSLLLPLSGVVLLHKKSSNSQVNSLLLDNGYTMNVSKPSQKVKSTELSWTVNMMIKFPFLEENFSKSYKNSVHSWLVPVPSVVNISRCSLWWV